MKRKIIPVAVALVLIVIIGVIAFGEEVLERYSYSNERADLDEYFGVTGNELAIVLQDEIIGEKALIHEGRCYFDLEMVSEYFNDGFYVDSSEGLLLYTTPEDVRRVEIGGTAEVRQTQIGGEAEESVGESEELGYTAAWQDGDTLYLAADYVKRYANFSYGVFGNHVQVYTEWGTKTVDTVKKDTSVRTAGDAEAPILTDLVKGDSVELLEAAEEWSLVKTGDSIIGYVENKRLERTSEGEADTFEETPVTDYTEPEYPAQALENRLCLGWHSIGGPGGNAQLKDAVSRAQGLNVIAPTWFSLNDTEGGFRSLASQDYINSAHDMGLQVWGVWDDFNYNQETGENVDVLSALSATTTRQKLAADIVSTALSLGLDGVNIDFERVQEENAADFVQFLRELSIVSHRNGLFLSVDDYIPYDYRSYFRLDVQGKVADYVIIMGYDEHWHGSGTPGSVASIDFVSEGIDLGLKNVPAEKLVNALPLFSRIWRTVGVDVSDETLSVRNTADYISKHDLTPVWDDVTCQNYAEWTEDDASYQLWIEDAESIGVKLNVMSGKNLGGVAVWRLGYGNEEVWQAIGQYLGQ